jgi:hypothetical protein
VKSKTPKKFGAFAAHLDKQCKTSAPNLSGLTELLCFAAEISAPWQHCMQPAISHIKKTLVENFEHNLAFYKSVLALVSFEATTLTLRPGKIRLFLTDKYDL